MPGAPAQPDPPTADPRERVVAAFDLDGTLTRRDTLLPFLMLACGRRRTAQALVAAGPLLARAATQGGRYRDASKAAVLARLLAGQSLDRLTTLADAYAETVVAREIRPDTRARLDWHLAEGHTVVIVTASPELYTSGIGRRLGVDAVLGTRLEVDASGRLTGHLDGANNRGPEKVARLAQWSGSDPVVTYAYGDSSGDDEMLALSANPVRLKGSRLRRTTGGSDSAR